MLLRVCKAVGLLALAGCTFMEKRYILEPTLPNGERLSGRWSPTYQHALVISYPGLDVEVAGQVQVIAQWVSPGPLPPLIPIPSDAWNHPRRVAIGISFFPYQKGYTFSPMRTRLQEDGVPVVQAEKWHGPQGFAVRRDNGPLPAQSEDNEVSIDSPMYIGIVFPVLAPLEGRAEVHFEGLRRHGIPVAFPVVPFWPKYQITGGSVP